MMITLGEMPEDGILMILEDLHFQIVDLEHQRDPDLSMRPSHCPCGAIIPYRHVYDYYRLTPQHKEVREQNRLGVRLSFFKRFMDGSEAATRRGETVLRFAAFTTRGSRNDAIYFWILRHCKSVGYLEYVCPQCEQALEFSQQHKRPYFRNRPVPLRMNNGHQ